MRLQSEVQQKENLIYEGSVNLEKLFELAIETANEGYKLKAMHIAKECIFFAKKTNSYLSIYVHGFLAVINIELNKLSSARIHLYHAFNRLDENHFDYQTDLKYLNALQRKVNALDSENPNTAIAA